MEALEDERRIDESLELREGRMRGGTFEIGRGGELRRQRGMVKGRLERGGSRLRTTFWCFFVSYSRDSGLGVFGNLD